MRRTFQMVWQKKMAGRRRRRKSTGRRPNQRVTSACPTLSVVISSPYKKISGRGARSAGFVNAKISVVVLLGLDPSLAVSDRYLVATKLLPCATSPSQATLGPQHRLEHYLNVFFFGSYRTRLGQGHPG